MESSSAVLSSATASNHKRGRDGAAGEAAAEAKRLRPEDLLDFLEDDTDAAAADDLASVMRSLEEEIAAGEVAPAPAQIELGFLLEASDDELGLPPAGAATSSEDDLGAWETADGFGGQIWGFEDQIDGVYGEYGVASSPEPAAAAAEWSDDGFDAGLFGFGDGPLDLAALRQETMPAV